MSRLSHFDNSGNAHMVDVSGKQETRRIAVACGQVAISHEAMRHVVEGKSRKGDVLAISRLAGIMAAKRTADLVPLCHPVPIDSVEVDFEIDREQSIISITSRVCCTGKTGVEMEALTAVSTAALTIYDMLKSVDRGIRILEVYLSTKTGGKSGDYGTP